MVHATLLLSYRGSCTNCSLFIPLIPHFRTFPHRITASQGELTLHEHPTHYWVRFSTADFLHLQVPFQKVPLKYRSLPFNSDLGLSQPPALLMSDGNVIASDAAVATIPVVDSTMRFDCATVGVVCLLLFTLSLFKQMVMCFLCLEQARRT